MHTAATAAGSTSMHRPGSTNPCWSQRWRKQHHIAQAAEKKERDLSTACEQWSMHTLHVGRQQFRKLNNIDVSRSPQPGSNSQKKTWQSRDGQEDPWQHIYIYIYIHIDRLQHWIFIENDRLWIGKNTGSKQQTLDLDACKHAPVRLRLPSESAVRKLRSESRAKIMFAPVERRDTDKLTKQKKRKDLWPAKFRCPGLSPGSFLWPLRGQRLAMPSSI